MIDWDGKVLGPCIGIFGEPIRYRTVALPGEPAVAFTMTGIFDEASFDQFAIPTMEGSGTVNRRPVLGIQVSQFTAVGIRPAEDDVLTRVGTGRVYQVAKVHFDSHGGARLDLSAADDIADPP